MPDDKTGVVEAEVAEGFAEATPGDGAPATGGERQPEQKPAEQPDPVEPPPKSGKEEADPVKQAEERAAQRQLEADQRLVAEQAERTRQEQARQQEQAPKFDLKMKLDEYQERAEKHGALFTSPDPDDKNPVTFAKLREEFPWAAELIVFSNAMASEAAIKPIREKLEQQDAEREYRAFVGVLEDPHGAAKLPAGSVEKLMQHAEMDAFFDTERPGLRTLLYSPDPADVAMALRAFASAKKLDYLNSATVETPEQQLAREDAIRRRSHRMAVHSGSPGGSGAPRNPRLNPDDEAAAGFAEGASEN
jgi:hypothetical protein